MLGDYLKRQEDGTPQGPPPEHATTAKKRQHILGKSTNRPMPVRLELLMPDINRLLESEKRGRHSQGAPFPAGDQFEDLTQTHNTIPETVCASKSRSSTLDTPGPVLSETERWKAPSVVVTKATPLKHTHLDAISEVEKENFTPLKVQKIGACATPAAVRGPLALISSEPSSVPQDKSPALHDVDAVSSIKTPALQSVEKAPPQRSSLESYCTPQATTQFSRSRFYGPSSIEIKGLGSTVRHSLLSSSVPVHPMVAAVQQQSSNKQNIGLQAPSHSSAPTSGILATRSIYHGNPFKTRSSNLASQNPQQISERQSYLSKPTTDPKSFLSPDDVQGFIVDLPHSTSKDGPKEDNVKLHLNANSAPALKDPKQLPQVDSKISDTQVKSNGHSPVGPNDRGPLVASLCSDVQGCDIDMPHSISKDEPIEGNVKLQLNINSESGVEDPKQTLLVDAKTSDIQAMSGGHSSVRQNDRGPLLTPTVDSKLYISDEFERKQVLPMALPIQDPRNLPVKNFHIPSQNRIISNTGSGVGSASRPDSRDGKEFLVPKPVSSSTNKSISKMDQIIVNGKAYTVLSPLGRGGSSVVYQVLDTLTSKPLAIKCVNLSETDASVCNGYLNEIKLLAQLQDGDCVIRMFDYEHRQHDNVLYVVMEKGDIDLSKLIKDMCRSKKISAVMILYYWIEMLSAVSFIHKRGIIHSDLKPSNFLLVSGRLKLIDFGIASSIQGDMTSVLKDSMSGTYNYISPEALCGTGSPSGQRYKITYKSDVWSLGCILYNLIYGQTPFQSIQNHFQKLNAIVNASHKIPFPTPPVEGCPPILIQALKSCLARNPKERPSVDELLQLPYLGHSGS